MSSAGSKPEPGKSGTQTVITSDVTVTPPTPPDDNGELEESLNELGERIAAAERAISDGIAGERQWTETTITSLRQELADLKAELQTLSQSAPQTLAELKEELTRLSQELSKVTEAQAGLSVTALTVTPPVEPPDPNSEPGAGGTPKTAAAPSAQQKQQGSPRRRVV